jgi:hypothetical protein
MPAGAWGPSGFAAKAGDPCMNNAGEAGVLREEGGWLYCEASYLGPSRAGTQGAGDVPPTRSDSAMSPHTMSAADAWAIRSAAYNEMVDQLQNQWRTPQG